jgi:hypothetical protein
MRDLRPLPAEVLLRKSVYVIKTAIKKGNHADKKINKTNQSGRNIISKA